MTERNDFVEVIIIGGGPAGLSAALILGRCSRSVIVFDHGKPRNRFTKSMHGFLGSDGENPREFVKRSREQLKKYDTVRIIDLEATSVCWKDVFTVKDINGDTYNSRMLLLASGVKDILPEIPDFEEYFGKSAFTCLFCDGFEFKDQPIAIYGKEKKGSEFAMETILWSKKVILCTDGPSDIDPEDQEKLDALGVKVFKQKITRLEGLNGMLEAIYFEDGSSAKAKVLFFNTRREQASQFGNCLKCKLTEQNDIEIGLHGVTSHNERLYVAGNCSSDSMQWVISAASEGAKAAFSMNKFLLEEQMKVLMDKRKRGIISSIESLTSPN